MKLSERTKAAIDRGPQPSPIGKDGIGVETYAMFATRIALMEREDAIREVAVAMKRLEASATPLDNETMDAVIPAAVWREFVDAHAALLYMRGGGDCG